MLIDTLRPMGSELLSKQNLIKNGGQNNVRKQSPKILQAYLNVTIMETGSRYL